MTALLWFYAGAVIGSIIGFITACILASNNRVREGEPDEHH